MHIRLVIAFLAGTTLGLTSCGASEQSEPVPSSPDPTPTSTASTPTASTPSLPAGARPAPTPEMIAQIPDLSVTDGFLLGGQPEPFDFEDLKLEGIKTVIDLRLPTETRAFDEPSAVIDAGMEYVPLGFSPQTLNDEILDKARTIMRDETRQPMLVHCASANRVGAVWLAFRILDEGLSEEAALAEARSVGLRSPAMQETVLEYVRKNKK